MTFHSVFQFLDLVLITPYRCGLPAEAAFWFGTAVLAFWCVLLGDASMCAGYLFNRSYYLELNKNMVKMNNLSIEAICRKEKAAYKATNKWANEYFGRAFFAQAALFAVSLWPLPFALAWLEIRFKGIDIVSLPFLQRGLGYPFVFISSYILVRFGFSKIKRFLPLLKKMDAIKAEDASLAGEMTSWAEILASQELEPKKKEQTGANTRV